MNDDEALRLKLRRQLDEILDGLVHSPFRISEIRLTVDKSLRVHGSAQVDCGSVSNSTLVPFDNN